MAEDRLDKAERILLEIDQRLNNVAKEQELFAGEMRQLHASQEEFQASQEKLQVSQKEFHASMEEIQVSHKKFHASMEELRASQKKTDEQLKETDEQQKKTDEQQKKTDEQIKKTEKGIDRMAKELGGIGGGLGRAAEGLTAPCVPKLFSKLGIKVDTVHQRVKALHEGQVKAEIDLLCPARRNGSSLILVGEVKAHLTHEDVQDFFDDSLISFKENFAEYKDRDVIAFVSGLNVEENAIKFAQKKGLYVLIPYGETMRIANLPDFEPKVW